MAMIRIKFFPEMLQEQIMWQFINNSLFQKTATLKDHKNNPGQAGADACILFRTAIQVRVRLDETSKLPELNFKGSIKDFSIEGTSLTVADDEFIPRGAFGIMEIDFINPPQTVKIQAL